jgi:3D (Asp-Asp-Asp) domain-containing protein
VKRVRNHIIGLSAAALLALGSLPAEADTYGSVSAYCETGTTANGDFTHWGEAAGASWLPFGSRVTVPGFGTVTIEDRGVPGLFLVDLAMPNDCYDAIQWGRRWLQVTVQRLGWGWIG